MGNIPLPALGVRPMENPLDIATKAANLKNMLLGQQNASMEMDAQKRALQDQETIKQAIRDSNGDLETAVKSVSGKINPQTALQLQQTINQQKLTTLNLVKTQGEVALQQSDAMQGAHDAVAKSTPDQKPMVYQQQLAQLHQMGIDTSQIPPQYPGDQGFEQIGWGLKTHSKMVKEALDQQKADAETMAAQARKTAADATAGKSGPLAPPVVAQAQAAFDARFQVNNPGQPTPDWAKLPPNATKQDVDRVDKQLEQVEKAVTAKQNFQASQNNVAANRGNARSDKSYQFNSAQLEKVGQPIDQAVSRLGRLQDTLAQRTPQADALVAPELLTVMAGGQGSGLRMNEAEISRIVGGRTNLESLKAQLNKWQLDPSKGLSITDAQRGQINALVNEVGAKLKAKQASLDEARQELLNTDDPGEHRKIVAKARSRMTQIDAGQSQTGNTGLDITLPSGKKIHID